MILLQDIMSLRSMMGESSMVRVSDQEASLLFNTLLLRARRHPALRGGCLRPSRCLVVLFIFF